jgi:hypothetical protein
VQSVSDLNGDDNPDLVVQSWISNESRLSVHSGKDGSSILRLDKNPIQDLYKSCVCDFGDTDGNGRREIAIGAFSTRDMVSVGAIHFVELTEGK